MQLVNSMKWSYHLAPLVPFAAVVLGCSLLGRDRTATVPQAAAPSTYGHPLIEMKADPTGIFTGMADLPRGMPLHFHRGSPGWPGRTRQEAAPHDGQIFRSVNAGAGRRGLMPEVRKAADRSWMEIY